MLMIIKTLNIRGVVKIYYQNILLVIIFKVVRLLTGSHLVNLSLSNRATMWQTREKISEKDGEKLADK